MEATELMIGDWVKLNDEDYKWQWSHHDFTISDFGNDIEPISLTAEIFEKNGLECKNGRISIEYQGEIAKDVWLSLQFSSLSYEHWNLRLSKCEEDGTFNIFLHIQYIHELQHALRLCGLNDLADNFKV